LHICFVFKKICNNINLVSQIICVPFVLARMSTGKYLFEEEKFNFKTNPCINIYIVNSTWYLIDCGLKKVWWVISRYWRLINSFSQKNWYIDWYWLMKNARCQIFDISRKHINIVTIRVQLITQSNIVTSVSSSLFSLFICILMCILSDMPSMLHSKRFNDSIISRSDPLNTKTNVDWWWKIHSIKYSIPRVSVLVYH